MVLVKVAGETGETQRMFFEIGETVATGEMVEWKSILYIDLPKNKLFYWYSLICLVLSHTTVKGKKFYPL